MLKINLAQRKGRLEKAREWLKSLAGPKPVGKPYTGPPRIIHLVLSSHTGAFTEKKLSEKELGKKPVVVGHQRADGTHPEQGRAHLLLDPHPLLSLVDAIIRLEKGRRITIRRGLNAKYPAFEFVSRGNGTIKRVDWLTLEGSLLTKGHQFLLPGMLTLTVAVRPEKTGWSAILRRPAVPSE